MPKSRNPAPDGDVYSDLYKASFPNDMSMDNLDYFIPDKTIKRKSVRRVNKKKSAKRIVSKGSRKTGGRRQ
jgi:hypothetical protein